MAKYKKRADGRYQANVSMGYDSSGKLIRKTVYARSIRDLDEKIFKLKQDTASGIKSSDMTLYDYSVSWFKTYKAMKSINTSALTPWEKKAILNADFTPMQKAFIYVLFYCGLRREEALALTPSDFDFKSQTVTINKAIVFDKNTPVLSAPKNISSNRTVPIPSEAIPVLKEYIANCKTIQLFTMRSDSVISLSSYVKFWNSIILALNFALFTDKQLETYKSLPKQLKKEICPIMDLTAHIFRHNYATMLYYSGISIKKAAALMGHTDTKMIMQVYAHLDDEKEQTSEKINACIKMG